MLSHPAGRGWVPASRDLGIPSEHPSTPVHEHRTITIEHAFPHGSPDDPVAAVGCSQVFTRERRVRFLDHLAFKGNVRAAAALVGVSHETAYRKRRQDAAFAALWDAALVHARKYGEAVLASRALDGEEVPVYFRGEIVGYRIVHDTRLLLAHLARLDQRVEQDEAATARAARFDELLAGYAGQEAPEGFAEAAEEALGWRERGEAPALPPTREEYLAWRRSQAVGGKSRRKEAEAMEAAAEAAGAEWDAWHAGSLERVSAIVEVETDDPWAEKPPAAPHPSPLAGEGGAPTGAEGEGSAAPAADGGAAPAGRQELGPEHPHPPAPSEEPDGEDGAPADPPYEIKSFPPGPADFAGPNPVTSVNPRALSPETDSLSVRCPGEVAPGVLPPSPASSPDLGGRQTMPTMLKGAAFALGALALTGTAAAQPAAPAPWTNDRAVLSASLGLGNSGKFTGLLNPEMTRMCYILNAGAVEQPTAARILAGAPGESGSVVLELENPEGGSSAGCVDVRADVARAMVENPGGYHLAISNAAYPNGYARAPLRAQRPTASASG